MEKRAGLAVVLVGSALATAALAALARSGVRWQGHAPALCMPAACFCEAVRLDAAIRQPSDTWSTLGYVVAGLAVLTSRDPPGARAGRGGLSLAAVRAAFGAALLFLGVGSAALHATLCLFGSRLDLVSMYAFASLVALDVVARALGARARTLALAFAAVNAALYALLVCVPSVRREAFGVVLGAMAVAVVLGRARLRPRGDGRWLVGAALVLVASLVVWVLDLGRRACWPTSWLQGHAIWHLGTAGAAALLYGYLRSEAGASAPT